MKFTRKKQPNIEEYLLEAKDLPLLLKKDNPFVLDIRSQEQFSKGALKKARNIPVEFLEEYLIQLPPFGTLVVYSDAEDTGVKNAISILIENGFSEVFYIQGGFDAVMKSMFEIDDAAKELILKKNNKDGCVGMKIAYDESFEIEFVKENEDLADLVSFVVIGVNFYADKNILSHLIDSKISLDKNNSDMLVIENPISNFKGSNKDRIQKVLDEQINPQVAMHGGWVKLIDVKTDTAYIEMGGGCQGCASTQVTLKQGIEVAIVESVPGILTILDVTDHAEGKNPYYRA